MAKEKIEIKDVGKKIIDLKMELLKNPTKKKSIKKEIARLITMKNKAKSDGGKN